MTRIQAFPTRAGRASPTALPNLSGTTMLTQRRWLASIRAMRSCCVLLGTALALARTIRSGGARRSWADPVHGSAWQVLGHSGYQGASGPWRSALALCWECEESWPEGEELGAPLLRRAFDRGVNAPSTTAVGRLFDAAAALMGLCLH